MRQKPRQLSDEQIAKLQVVSDRIELQEQRAERVGDHKAATRAAHVRAHSYGLTTEERVGVTDQVRHLAGLKAQRDGVLQAQARAEAEVEQPRARKQPIPPSQPYVPPPQEGQAVDPIAPPKATNA